MKTYTLIVLAVVFVLFSVFCGFDKPADAQYAYRNIIKDMSATTDAEKSLQTAVKANSCKHCHPNVKNKKIRTEFGMKLHDALGGGKFNKLLWKKTNGQYSPAAIKMLRDAINATAKKK